MALSMRCARYSNKAIARPKPAISKGKILFLFPLTYRDPRLDIGKRGRAVDLGLARAEEGSLSGQRSVARASRW